MAIPAPILIDDGQGQVLALHDFGGTGPDILFCHATGLHGWVWQPTAYALRDRFHSWAVDLHGHGDSPLAPDDDFGWARFGEDVLRTTAAMGKPGLIGVGHSLGGAALVMAELGRPGTFSQLLMFEPGIQTLPVPLTSPYRAYQQKIVENTARRRPAFPSKAAALENFARKPPLSELQASALHAYVTHGLAEMADGGVALKCSPATEAGFYAAFCDHDIALLQTLRCPVALFKGMRTEPEQHSAVDALAHLLDAPIVALSDVGHLGPLQLPARFAAAVAQRIADTALQPQA
jgi:pimeloyl-ACP methyl ester carboxylesterase